MAQERGAVLLLCAFMLASVAIVSWNSTQETSLLSSSEIASEESKLQAIEDQMMGASNAKALAQAKRATKLQALINSQKLKMQQSVSLKPAKPLVSAHPARVQTLAYQPKKPTMVYHPYHPSPSEGIRQLRKINPMKVEGLAPAPLDKSQNAEVAARTQAAALARNLAAAQGAAHTAQRMPVPMSSAAAQLAKNIKAHAPQSFKPAVGWDAHPSAHERQAVAAMHAAHAAPPAGNPWDTTNPSTPTGKLAAQPKAAQPKAPPGYVAVRALMPGQTLPKGAVTIPTNYINKLAGKGAWVPGPAAA